LQRLKAAESVRDIDVDSKVELAPRFIPAECTQVQFSRPLVPTGHLTADGTQADLVELRLPLPRSLGSSSFRYVETELERWDTELEAERSALAPSIFGTVPGDIITSESAGNCCGCRLRP
jgi:hypothetical protein